MPTGSAAQSRRIPGTPPLVMAAAVLVAALAACGGRPSSPWPRAAADARLAAADTSRGGGGCALADSLGAAQPTMADADVAITAHVHAQSVRVEHAENVRARFPGQGARDTVSCVVRTNLPHPLQPGRTYHDVTLDLRILTRFDTAAARAAADTAHTPATPGGGTRPHPTGATP